MNNNMNGRAIQRIFFAGGVGNYSGNPEMIEANGERRLNLSATFHGDEFCVVESDANYRELRRHSIRSIATIEWEPEPEVSAGVGK